MEYTVKLNGDSRRLFEFIALGLFYTSNNPQFATDAETATAVVNGLKRGEVPTIYLDRYPTVKCVQKK